MHETIPTVNIDFIPAAIRMVLLAILMRAGLSLGFDTCWESLHTTVPDWLQVRIGTDDLPDAHRSHPTAMGQLCVSVTAVYVPNVGWRFVIMFG